MKNNIEEMAANIEFCPYCCSDDLDKEMYGGIEVSCNDCGRDFTVMTHE